jgi:hypothetical protein
MNPPTLCASPERLLSLKDEVAPLPSPKTVGVVIHAAVAAAKDFPKYLHPAFLILGCVGIKVNDLAIVEADAKPFLNKHVAFFFFSEG